MTTGADTMDELWAQVEHRYSLLTPAQASRAASEGGEESATPALDLRRAGRLMGIDRDNTVLFPGFQFADGHVLPAVERVARAASELQVPDEDALAWFMLPTRQLNDDAAPVDRLNDPAAVEAAFRNHFGVQW